MPLSKKTNNDFEWRDFPHATSLNRHAADFRVGRVFSLAIPQSTEPHWGFDLP
jgi:hypothetical protein